MNTQHLFCLSGWGYLQDVIEKHGQFTVRIKVMTDDDSKACFHDEVTLDMDVNYFTYQAYLRKLLRLVQAGHCIMIHFMAKYSQFIEAYSGLVPEDPQHMVMMKAKLQTLSSCSINGELAEMDVLQPRAVA